MILESRLESRTRGLVCGATTLSAPHPGTSRIILPGAELRRAKPLAKRELHVAETITPRGVWRPWDRWWKVEVRAHEGGEILWQRPFASEREAQLVYLRLIGLDIDRLEHSRQPIRLPSTWRDGDLDIIIATVVTFNTSNVDATHDWNNGGNLTPTGVTTATYLDVAGGGSGGGAAANGSGPGGGGGGGLLTGTQSVTPGGSNTITVGTGGAQTATGNAQGNSGLASIFVANTANPGGGGGGGGGNSNGLSQSANTTGSGGGTYTAAGSVGLGTAGQGNNGGLGSSSNPNGGGGGGGGANAVGGAGSANGGGNGGNGTASSITGSSVTYAGGGGGGSAAGGSGGTGGTGGGGTGVANATGGSAGTTNLGGGGGGGGPSVGAAQAGLAGGKGVIILSFTAASGTIFTLAFLH